MRPYTATICDEYWKGVPATGASAGALPGGRAVPDVPIAAADASTVQAGWSSRGREFAAKHAEAILLPKKDPQEIAAG
jgi:hypothetical protein